MSDERPSAESDWGFSDDQLREQGEWFRWDPETAEKRPDLAEAVAAFEAHSANAKAAQAGTEWFSGGALHEGGCVTRMLVISGHVAAFYALASGEARISSEKTKLRMGVEGSDRIGSSHVEWVARDHRAPAGAGELAVQHAIFVALEVSDLQGNRILTMDPFDESTQEMWREKGFHPTQTELADGLRRLYVPLFGPYYGRFDRGIEAATR